MTSICVLGLGYIGLPTSALLASQGYRVYGVDVRPEIVETVSAGRVHITEADLDGLVQKVVNSGLLTAHSEPCPADAFIITAPTPLTKDRRPQLDCVFAAASSIAPLLKRGDIVIVESTCPVGTTRNIAKLLAAARPDLAIAGSGGAISDVSIAYCPERVLPGRILIELIDNDRCVGGLTPVCTERAAQLYESFVRGSVLRTDPRTKDS
jgi:UDP-N-acetyl-D-mannosaminuronic acid dehydrogenase